MRQAAALPYRRTSAGGIELLLVTTSSKHWIIPKGDIDDGMEAHLAAEKEAFEEGGVRGRIDDRAIGAFRTCKKQDGAEISAEIDIFPLEVSEELASWPEMEERERRWLSLDEAAAKVEEAELSEILRNFAP